MRRDWWETETDLERSDMVDEEEEEEEAEEMDERRGGLGK